MSQRLQPTSTATSCPSAVSSDARQAPAQRWSPTPYRSRPRCGSSTTKPAASAKRVRSARCGCTAITSPTGYWGKSPEEQQCFGATLVDPSPGTPDGPWLRTGDLGFISEGELFIVGRIKDLLIIRGRNHYPEDIEATVQEITRGRVAAISVPLHSTEKPRDRDRVQEEARGLNGGDDCTGSARSRATSRRRYRMRTALNVGDLVVVPPGSIPTTTSGKVRRAACIEAYQQEQFVRLDA